MGSLKVSDSENRIYSVIKTVEGSGAIGGVLDGMKGMMTFNKKEGDIVKDFNEVQIRVYKKVGKNEKMNFAEGNGNFARYLRINKEIWWTWDKLDPANVMDYVRVEEYELPTSSNKRKDIIFIRE